MAQKDAWRAPGALALPLWLMGRKQACMPLWRSRHQIRPRQQMGTHNVWSRSWATKPVWDSTGFTHSTAGPVHCLPSVSQGARQAPRGPKFVFLHRTVLHVGLQEIRHWVGRGAHVVANPLAMGCVRGGIR